MNADRNPPPRMPACTVVPIVSPGRAQLASALDGRYGPLDPSALSDVMAWLTPQFDLDGVDCVVGIPEGGLVAAYAFAAAADLPVVLGSIWCPDIPGIVSFEDARAPIGWNGKHIMGLKPGDCVIVIEAAITSGRTLINCVRALRAAGIRCDQAGAIYAADDPDLRSRLAAEQIVTHVPGTVDRDICRQLGERSSP